MKAIKIHENGQVVVINLLGDVNYLPVMEVFGKELGISQENIGRMNAINLPIPFVLLADNNIPSPAPPLNRVASKVAGSEIYGKVIITKADITTTPTPRPIGLEDREISWLIDNIIQ